MCTINDYEVVAFLDPVGSDGERSSLAAIERNAELEVAVAMLIVG
jgi:hypothetical protein